METFKWGKQTLATLSTGLYANPFFIYREYVQNAADAIEEAIDKGLITRDAAQILLDVDAEKREITIRDNGVGVERSRVAATLGNIGDSQKKADSCIGRFGIGRMGGLGYCEKLIFETSAYGDDTKSVVECDAKKLRDALGSPDVTDDASAIWLSIVNTREEPVDRNERFFTVKLLGVYESHDELLDVDEVRKYLSQVAPVPFTSLFARRDKIKKFCAENEFELREYALFLNGDEVFKCYTDPFDDPCNGKIAKVEVRDVQCGILEENGQCWGWYWYGETDFDGALHKYCLQKGLRLRQWNVQIGESDCLNQAKGWPEERGNNYFIGEIHANPKKLNPNARRDYFIQDDNCRVFERQLQKFFRELTPIYRVASERRACDKKIEAGRRAQEEYERQESQGFFDRQAEEKARQERDSKLAAAQKAQKEREKLERKCLEAAETSGTPSETPTRRTLRNIVERATKVATPPPPLPQPVRLIVETSAKQDAANAPSKPPVTPSRSQYWIDAFEPGERRILEIVQKVLKASLKESEADKIWSKITQKITEQ